MCARIHIGQKIGQYEIREKLGESGTVWLAYDEALDRNVALKSIRESFSRASLRERFLQEARTIADLKHPHIVKLYSMDVHRIVDHHPDNEEELWYVVMEFVSQNGRSRTLRNVLDERGGTLPLEQAQKIFDQLCSALSYAHSRNVLHCNIKPSNVLVDGNGNVRLSDFGLSKVPGAGQTGRSILNITGGAGEESRMREPRVRSLIETWEYMPPEVREGRGWTKAGDVFSLGSVVYRMLTGRRPVGRWINLPSWWNELLEKCLDARPEDRYADGEKVLSAYKSFKALEIVPQVQELSGEGPFSLFMQGQKKEEAGEYEKAFAYYSKAAERGHAGAQFNVGRMYDRGQGVSQNDDQAADWYRRAARQGYAAAQFRLGMMCYEGRLYYKGRGAENDDRQAADWYRRAARQGYAAAQNNLGMMYRNGEGVERDDKQAVEWYRRAVEQGYAEAQFNLGWMYANGRGVEQNDRQAADWYRRAAEQGHAEARCNLGAMYRDGQGVEQDDRQAAEWYRRAAEQGHAYAQFNLSVMYANGRGVERDDKQAVEWYRRAVGQGVQRRSVSPGSGVTVTARE
jgi:TPR repeat protein/tRNA A-37 threonylcarbamoyl transferase component Bud32